MFPAI
ncbi:hypothetical protein E2C01_088992 [Portunus trituberculatus]